MSSSSAISLGRLPAPYSARTLSRVYGEPDVVVGAASGGGADPRGGCGMERILSRRPPGVTLRFCARRGPPARVARRRRNRRCGAVPVSAALRRARAECSRVRRDRA
jgi:hypothetical protein